MSKIALVTGGTDGVGRSLVRALFNEDYDVHCIGRNPDKGALLAKELTSGGGSFQFWQADLSDLDEIEAFAGKLKNRVSKLSRVVFSAGVVLPKREETWQGLEKTFAVNYLSAYYLSKLLKPELMCGARVLFVSGSAGLVLKPRLDFSDLQLENNYNAVKAAANSVHAKTVLVQMLAKEWAEDGVNVNAFHPGVVRSGLTRNMPFLLDKAVRLASLALPSNSKTGIDAALADNYEGLTGYYFSGKKKLLAFEERYCDQLREASEALL